MKGTHIFHESHTQETTHDPEVGYQIPDHSHQWSPIQVGKRKKNPTLPETY